METGQKIFHSILPMLLTISFLGVSFAGTDIGDVPSSPNETRKIVREDSLYNESCDLSQELAFYENSPVYLRVGQPKTTANVAFDKTETYVRAYNKNLFSGELSFPYISNFVPSTSIDSSNGDILIVDAVGATFLGLNNIIRNEPAGQLVTKNTTRTAIQNPNGEDLNYYYIRANDMSNHNGAFKALLNPNPTNRTSCTSYYIARCGDGIVDKKTGDSDGNGGITTKQGTFIKRHSWSFKPDEVCDDGEDNGEPGKCKIDCSGYDDGEVGEMTVTKKLTIEQNYNPQETLQFRIDFSNPGKDKLENIQIEDVLPQGFEYISSEIYGVQGATLSTGKKQSDFLIVYKGFSLNPGAEGYILINAKMLSCNFTLNNVFWEAISNGQTITGHTTKLVNCSSDPVNISKIASPSTVAGGQMVRFTITVNNSTDETISNVRVEDEWPNCISLVNGSVVANMQTAQTTIGNTTQWSIQNSLNPGQSLVISFFGQTSDSPNCLGTHTNTGRVLFANSEGNSQVDTTAKVTIAQASHNLGIKKEVTQDAFGPGDYVTYLITYKNYGSQPVSSFRIKDYWPSSLEFVSATPSPNSRISPLEVPIVWNINKVLGPGEEGEIEITARIKTDLK